MEEIGQGSGIGRRIRAVRKARRIKSTAELAALIPGTPLSGAVLRNIESGTKPDLAVSELLNIARALNVSPIYLLTPIREPEALLDLPNLSSNFDHMTAIEFDEWLSGSSDTIHEWTTPDDFGERNQIRAMRELERQKLELDRISRLSANIPQSYLPSTADSPNDKMGADEKRKAEIVHQIGRLTGFLEAAGWDVTRWL